MKAEVVLIGTGGGYGESVLVRLKDNHWIVVDSCVDPKTKDSLPLTYLIERGVDIKNDVKLIVCTHWHDDHIQGLSKLLSLAENASFSFASCHDKSKFLLFVGLDAEKESKSVSNSSTREFSECLEIVKKRGASVKAAIQDRTLYRHEDCLVYALSPSDFTLERYNEEISELITEYGRPDKKIITSSPNAKSVALYVKIGKHSALLGADLEVSSDNREGWVNVIEKCTVIDQPATYFKVPHHGSDTAYHKNIWEILLDKDPVSNLTPWNRNGKLPQVHMLEILAGHTKNLSITSPVIGGKAKKRERSLEKFIKQVNPTIQEVKYKWGVIKCSIDPDVQNDTWLTEYQGEAVDVRKLIDTKS